MDHLNPLMRKYDFPDSVKEALQIVHIQCEKMSKNSVSISQDLNKISEFVDDFVFGHPHKKIKSLGSIQQMQIIQVLLEHFTCDMDFSLLCSVFMVVFLAKGRQFDFKIDTLSKLMSVTLGQGHKTLLNCAALWWTQQPPHSEQCRIVTKHLVDDLIILLPATPSLTATNNGDLQTGVGATHPLAHIPDQSPLLAGILLTYFTDLYTLPGSSSTAATRTKTTTTSAYQPPPVQLVDLAASWLSQDVDLCGAQATAEIQGVVTMLGRSPVSGLAVWTVMCPLVCEPDIDESYAALHFCLLQHITEDNAEYSMPKGFLSHLTETLLSTLNSTSFSDQQINQTLDRFGQLLQAARSAKCRIEEDLLLLINQLPYNRLINIILSSHG